MKCVGPISLILLSFLISCAKKDNYFEQYAYLEQSVGTPTRLYDYELSYQGSEEASDFGLFYDFAMDGNLRFMYDFTASHAWYQSIEFGGEFEYELYRLGSEYFRHGARTLESSKIFRPIGDGNYPLETYQSAVVHVGNTLASVQEKLVAIGVGEIEPVKIKIAPMIKHKVDHKVEGYYINNAAYMRNEKSIVFFPQGYDRLGNIPFWGIPMWRIPFFAAHEYGHHIFYHLLENHLESDSQNTGLHTPCFDNSNGHKVHLGRSGGQMNKRAFMISALNESFADLFAHYTIEDQFPLTSNLICFYESRNISNGHFANGQSKILTNALLGNFLNPPVRTEVGAQSCTEVLRHDDPHMLGAAIAFGVDRIFSDQGRERSEKLSLLLQWGSRLASIGISNRRLTPQDLLRNALHALESEKTTEIFPFLAP